MGDLVNSVADVFGFGPASKQLKAADRAADISAAASREAIDLQRKMYYEGVARQQPWLEAGQIALNNVLQGKVAEGMSDLMRFALNSTWGLLGLLDVAGEAGLPKHDEDLGQTLGRWGVGEGAYIVLPFFGPRTVRDAVALPADFIANEPFSIDHVATRNTVLGTRVVHLRSTLLGADRTLEEAALDRYVFVRDFYLEQRRYKVSDGRQERVYEDFDEQSAAPPGGDVDTAAASAVGNLEHADIGASPATAGRRVARQSVQ